MRLVLRLAAINVYIGILVVAVTDLTPDWLGIYVLVGILMLIAVGLILDVAGKPEGVMVAFLSAFGFVVMGGTAALLLGHVYLGVFAPFVAFLLNVLAAKLDWDVDTTLAKLAGRRARAQGVGGALAFFVALVAVAEPLGGRAPSFLVLSPMLACGLILLEWARRQSRHPSPNVQRDPGG